MDPGLGFLFAAFFVAWLVLLLYVWNLASRLSGLRRELDALKRQEGDEPENDD